MSTTVWGYGVLGAGALAFILTVYIEYTASLHRHMDIYTQYVTLADSTICRNAAQRLSTVAVNRCSEADAAVSGLNPRWSAVVDVLFYIPLTKATEAITTMSIKLMVLILSSGVCVSWLYLHKWRYEAEYRRSGSSLPTTLFQREIPCYARMPELCD